MNTYTEQSLLWHLFLHANRDTKQVWFSVPFFIDLNLHGNPIIKNGVRTSVDLETFLQTLGEIIALYIPCATPCI